jgi:DNA segregation ATPase FtsK/SpoIIIE-like protein
VEEGRLRQVDHGVYAPVTAPAEPDAKGDASGIDPAVLVLAAKLVVSTQFASQSMLHRKLRIGFAMTAQVLDALEARGIVGPSQGATARDVLVKPDAKDEALRELAHDLGLTTTSN